MTAAHKLSEEGRFAEAHECLLDVLTLYQEAELEIPEELLSKIHLCEEAMKGATGEINEAHALVDRASLLLLRSDEPSEEVRTLLEHAGQIFIKNNVIDNGFNRIARIVFGPSANKFIYPNLNLNDIAIECEKLIQNDDLDNAISALELGSAEGHVISQGLLGFSYLQKANLYKNTSIALLLHAANNNDPFAQLILGECHELGINLPKDNTKAFEYYLNSAKSGNAKAQYKLGQCYATAIGTDLNLSQAANWYRKSAEQGEVDAQIAFGLCYRFGWGVTLDHIEAVRWLEKAAASGSQEAKNTLVRWGKSLTENEILQCIMPFIPFTDFWSYPIAPEGQTKLRNAKTSCGVEPGEKVLGLLDLTVFGSAKDALLFGDKNIYFKNSGVEFKLTYVDFLYLLPETNEEAINANFLIIPTIGCLLLGSSGRPIWNIFSMLKAKLFESSITTFTEGKELFDINIKPNSEKPPESKPSETEIFNRFLKLAMIGKIDAAREVSRRYRMGIGTAQNYGQADWWELFAEGKVQL
jgi:TPR repeat protein